MFDGSVVLRGPGVCIPGIGTRGVKCIERPFSTASTANACVKGDCCKANGLEQRTWGKLLQNLLLWQAPSQAPARPLAMRSGRGNEG